MSSFIDMSNVTLSYSGHSEKYFLTTSFFKKCRQNAMVFSGGKYVKPHTASSKILCNNSKIRYSLCLGLWRSSGLLSNSADFVSIRQLPGKCLEESTQVKIVAMSPSVYEDKCIEYWICLITRWHFPTLFILVSHSCSNFTRRSRMKAIFSLLESAREGAWIELFFVGITQYFQCY